MRWCFQHWMLLCIPSLVCPVIKIHLGENLALVLFNWWNSLLTLNLKMDGVDAAMLPRLLQSCNPDSNRVPHTHTFYCPSGPLSLSHLCIGSSEWQSMQTQAGAFSHVARWFAFLGSQVPFTAVGHKYTNSKAPSRNFNVSNTTANGQLAECLLLPLKIQDSENTKFWLFCATSSELCEYTVKSGVLIWDLHT